MTNGNGCVILTMEVWNTTNGQLFHPWFYPTSGCVTEKYILTNHGSWGITEWVNYPNSDNIIEVDFLLSGGNHGAYFQYTMTPPTNWVWLRSNICWCGTGGGNATFSSASGESSVYSNLDIYAVNPPIDVLTAENSNMQYGCFTQSGTEVMNQNFGLMGMC